MTSITPRLNCSYCRRDGRYPVVIRVIRQRCKREINTSLLASKEEFDNQIGQITSHPRRRYPPGMIAEANRLLADMCSELLRISEDLYRSACSCLRNFLGTPVLSFESFTSNLVDRFASHLRQRGKRENTVICYLKQLRALYNKALKDHVVKTDLHPFRNQVLKEELTRKRALSQKDVKKLEKADLTGCHKDVLLVCDLFMSSIHLRGMSFVDLSYITKECIGN